MHAVDYNKNLYCLIHSKVSNIIRVKINTYQLSVDAVQHLWQLNYNVDSEEAVRTFVILKFSAAADESARRRLIKQEKLYAYIATMRTALNMFQGQCAYCYMVKKPSQGFHGINACPQLPPTSFRQYVTFRNQVRYNKTGTHICWMCHVPSCFDMLHKPFEGKKATNCEYRDIVLPIAYAIFNISQYRTEAERDIQTKWKTIHDFTTWLNTKPATDQQSQPTALFLWFYHKFVTNK